MWHPHQEEGASALLEIDLDCILPEYWSQYTQVDTAYHTSPTGADICEQSSLMYPPDVSHYTMNKLLLISLDAVIIVNYISLFYN